MQFQALLPEGIHEATPLRLFGPSPGLPCLAATPGLNGCKFCTCCMPQLGFQALHFALQRCYLRIPAPDTRQLLLQNFDGDCTIRVFKLCDIWTENRSSRIGNRASKEGQPGRGESAVVKDIGLIVARRAKRYPSSTKSAGFLLGWVNSQLASQHGQTITHSVSRNEAKPLPVVRTLEIQNMKFLNERLLWTAYWNQFDHLKAGTME